MGGTGSGHWSYHDKKRTVEERWAMSISDMDRFVDLRNFGSASRTLRPIKPGTGKRMSPCAAHRRLAMRVGSIPRHHALPTCPSDTEPRPRNGVSRRFCCHEWRVDGEIGGESGGPFLC